MTMADEPVANAATLQPRSRRRRSILAGVVLVLACLSIVLTTVAVWTHQVAFNTDRFTALVTNVVADPEVIDPLSARISQQVVDAVGVQARIEARLPDAVKPLAASLTVAIRDAIDKRLQVALSNPKVQAALLTSVSFTHAQVMAVLRGDPDNVNIVDGYVTVDVFPIVGAALQQLQEIGLIPANVQLPDLSTPQQPGVLAQRVATVLGVTLPADFGTIQLMPADKLLAARTAVQAFDIIVAVLIALSILLVALALWLADRRRRMVIFLAIGTIIAFVIARTLIRGAEGAIVGGIADQDLAGAVRTTLDAVFDDLRGLTLIVLIGTAIVGVAAYLWGRPAWVVTGAQAVGGVAGQAGSAVAGQAGAGRTGMTEVVRDNRTTVERAGLALIAFIVVWLVVGIEVAILAAALVAGLELVLGAIGTKPEETAAPVDTPPAAPVEAAPVAAVEPPAAAPAPVETPPAAPAATPPAAAKRTRSPRTTKGTKGS